VRHGEHVPPVRKRGQFDAFRLEAGDALRKIPLVEDDEGVADLAAGFLDRMG